MNSQNNTKRFPKAPSEESLGATREYGQHQALHDLLLFSYQTNSKETDSAQNIQRAPDRSDTRRIPWLFKAAACLAITGLFAGIFFTNKSPRMPNNNRGNIPQVVSLEGNVMLYRYGENNWIRPSNGDTIHGHSTVLTERDSRVTLKYSDGTVVMLHPLSELNGNFTENNQRKEISIVDGFVFLNVAKQPQGLSMAVNTPHGAVDVLGTQLQVNVESDFVETSVSHGVVSFKRPGDKKALLVKTGQIATLGPNIKRLAVNDDSLSPEVLDFSLISVASGQAITGYDPIPPKALFR
ncbi:MAG: FecR family protein [Opitutales bacterium]